MSPLHAVMVVTLLALSLQRAFAGPVSPTTVPDLLERSDVVLVGRFTETAGGSSKPVQAWLHVDRVIKGELKTVGTDVPFGAFRLSQPRLPRYGIFFLHDQNGALTLTDRATFCLPAAPSQYDATAQAGDPLHKVAAALASIFMVPPDVILDPQSGLRPATGLASVPNGRDGAGKRVFKLEPPTPAMLATGPYFDAVTALRSIPRETRLPFILRVLDSHGPALGRVWAYAAALEAGDRSHLFIEDKYLLHPSEGQPATNASLMLAFQRARTTEQDAPFFAMLMASTNERIREGAAFKLRDMNSGVALRALEVGLGDEDPEVRNYALNGVCAHISVCDDQRESELVQPANVARIAAAYHAWLSTGPH